MQQYINKTMKTLHSIIPNASIEGKGVDSDKLRQTLKWSLYNRYGALL